MPAPILRAHGAYQTGSAGDLCPERTFYFYRGRVALFALLQALDLHRGDEVLLQAYTCSAVPIPIVGLGFRPVYLDIEKSTLNLDPMRLEQNITSRTKAIVVQHTFGIPAKIDVVLEVAKRHGITVIEDCCHALGSRYAGAYLGSFGDAAFYSYEWGKPVVIGLGGTAVVNSDELFQKVDRLYRTFVAPSALNIFMLNLEYIAYSVLRRRGLFWQVRGLYKKLWQHGLIIGNFRHGELEGHLTSDYWQKMPESFRNRLATKLKGMHSLIRHRMWVVTQYEKGLRDLGLTRPDVADVADAVLLRYPFFVTDKAQVLKEARRRNVELGGWFVSPVDPLSEDRWWSVGYEKGSCPLAETASRHTVTLPVHEGTRKADIDRSLDFVREMRDRGLVCNA